MKKSRSRIKKKLEEKILMQKRVDKPRPSDRRRFVLEAESKAAQSRRHALCYRAGAGVTEVAGFLAEGQAQA